MARLTVPTWGALVLLLGTAGSCASVPEVGVPLVPRPDTRKIGLVQLDSATMHGTLQILQRALPRETAVCYTGFLSDTLVEGTVWKVLHLEGVRESLADSTTEMYVFFPAVPRTGCSEAIAAGHSHPYTGGGVCSHSDLDANVLFTDPRLLVGIVWCADGRLEILYQDGRRTGARWRP